MTGFTGAHPFSLPCATPSRRIPLGFVLIQAVHFIVTLKMVAYRTGCLSQLGIYGISTRSDEIKQPTGKKRTGSKFTADAGFLHEKLLQLLLCAETR
jgi:hypothetical protein